VNLQRTGAWLIAAGTALALLPSLAVDAADRLARRQHEAGVARWMEYQAATAATPAASTAQTAPTVIEPGEEGYLLEIPKLGLRAVVRQLEPEVLEGQNTPRLRRYGLGQVPHADGLRNVSPGAEGTAVIAGHRTTSGAPFRHVQRLGPGDLIVVRKARAEQHWRVVYATTVAPDDVEAIRSQPGVRRLALVACSPPFGATWRLIVYATLDREGTH